MIWKCTYSTTAGAIDFTFVAYAEAGGSRKDPSFNYARILPPSAAGTSPPAHVPYRLGRTPLGVPLLITLNPDGTDKATMTRGAELSLPLSDSWSPQNATAFSAAGGAAREAGVGLRPQKL